MKKIKSESKMVKVKLKSLSEIKKIFASKRFKKEFEELEKKNRQLIESTKIDTKSLSNTFDF